MTSFSRKSMHLAPALLTLAAEPSYPKQTLFYFLMPKSSGKLYVQITTSSPQFEDTIPDLIGYGIDNCRFTIDGHCTIDLPINYDIQSSAQKDLVEETIYDCAKELRETRLNPIAIPSGNIFTCELTKTANLKNNNQRNTYEPYPWYNDYGYDIAVNVGPYVNNEAI